MDKRLIRPLEGWMAIPQIVEILGLSRARVHQLIDEDKFDLNDMRVVGEKRMVLVKNAAVYRQLQNQEDRAARIAADRQAEEQRIMARAATREVFSAIRHDTANPSLTASPIPQASPEDKLDDLSI